jgi:hypothetical protein
MYRYLYAIVYPKFIAISPYLYIYVICCLNGEDSGQRLG